MNQDIDKILKILNQNFFDVQKESEKISNNESEEILQMFMHQQKQMDEMKSKL